MRPQHGRPWQGERLQKYSNKETLEAPNKLKTIQINKDINIGRNPMFLLTTQYSSC